MADYRLQRLYRSIGSEFVVIVIIGHFYNGKSRQSPIEFHGENLKKNQKVTVSAVGLFV